MINGEENVMLHAIRVHETLSGYAEASAEDLEMVTFSIADLKLNGGIQKEWKDNSWWRLIGGL